MTFRHLSAAARRDARYVKPRTLKTADCELDLKFFRDSDKFEVWARPTTRATGRNFSKIYGPFCRSIHRSCVGPMEWTRALLTEFGKRKSGFSLFMLSSIASLFESLRSNVSSIADVWYHVPSNELSCCYMAD